MQNLFSLGLGPANPTDQSTGLRAGRPRHRATDPDTATADHMSFDLLLAMAATPGYTEQPEPLKTSLSIQRPQGDTEAGELEIPTGARPVAVEQAPRFTTWSGRLDMAMQDGPGTSVQPPAAPSITREQWNARLRNIFDDIAAEGTETAIAPRDGAERRAPRLLPLDGGQQPVEPETAPEATTRQGQVTALRAGDSLPERHEVEGERPATAVPNLKVVARNDRPAEPSGASQPAQLRVVHADGSISNPRADEALLNRLADNWRHSFAGDDIQLPEIAPEQTIARGPESQASGGEIAGPTATDAGALRLRDTRGGGAGHASDERRERPDTSARPVDTGRAADGARPATVVPLFGTLLATETRQAEGQPEGPVGVGRALDEIASEAQRLERAGGSELSFSMKLAPEHLGQIEIDIQRVDNRWSISITTAGDAARETLAAELHRLERSLREHNFTLESVSVVTRGQETALPAPAAPEQAATADWFGGQEQHFESSRNWDESGRRAPGGNETIGFDARRDGNAEIELSASPASASLSGIDIQA